MKRKVWLAPLFAGMLSGSAFAGSSQERLDALAAQGQIQRNAPVQAGAEIIIHASPAKVWQLLTDIDHWPQWQSTVSAAHIDGTCERGTDFAWTDGGTQIRARLALVRPNAAVAWTGTAYQAHAIHVWTLEELPDGSTRVKTTESMDGMLLRMFFSSQDLSKSLKVFLKALQHRAEE